MLRTRHAPLFLLIALLLLPTSALGAGSSGSAGSTSGSQATPVTAPAEFACANVEEIPLAECQALVDLFNSTGGLHWGAKAGWLVTFTPCTWRGVTCDGQAGETGRHVTALQLNDNNLVGSLPASLSNLTQLRTLTLSNNELTGALPASLGDLAQLQVLNLGNNQLNGAMPSSIGNLASLQVLALGGNGLSGALPAELGNLPAVQQLILASNQFSGTIPSELGSLATLQVLNLGSNQLQGEIPTALSNLTALQRLILSVNHLTGPVPAELDQLSNLRQLWLDRNHLSGPIPPVLGSLAGLEALGLAGNQIEGAIPAELGNLANLQELWLTSNRLSGAVPQALCDLPGLFFLDLGYNALSSAPDCIAGIDPFWARTQTVPPTDLTAVANADGTITLTWTPITYDIDSGYYEISAALAGGDFGVVGQTADKTANSYVVDGLPPATAVELQVRTFTPSHDTAPAYQQNDLFSDYTPSVTATTASSPTRILYFPLTPVQPETLRR